jgi:hypothetical protein
MLNYRSTHQRVGIVEERGVCKIRKEGMDVESPRRRALTER